MILCYPESALLTHVRDLLSRPDFHENPARAVWRRFTWRRQWAQSPGPHPVRLRNGAVVYAPTQGGMGGLIHYQGCSERDTYDFLLRNIEPGTVFWDVGAHIGEYAVMAAAQGAEVHAFEADPALCKLIRQARKDNSLERLTVVQAAVADRAGELEFAVCEEPSVSSLASGVAEGSQRAIRVSAITLDDYARQFRRPQVIKVDVEGAEQMVLRGAKSLLADPSITWVLEYTPANCARFGYHPDRLLDTFHSMGYETYWLRKGGELAETDVPCGVDSINVVARRTAGADRRAATA